jgi:hypothetical protein
MSANPQVEDAISTLEGWLPNESRGYADLIARLLSSLPGGEELEGMGYEPLPYLGWQEADMIGKLLAVVRDSGDVAEAARRLFYPAKGDPLHEGGDEEGSNRWFEMRFESTGSNLQTTAKGSPFRIRLAPRGV